MRNEKNIIRDSVSAFFAELAKNHPEVKTGDFPPDAEAAFEAAATVAAERWLEINAPRPVTDDEIVSASAEFVVMLRPPRKGERGWLVKARTARAALREVIRESEDLGWIAQYDHTEDEDENGMIAVTIKLKQPEAGAVPAFDAAAFALTLPPYRSLGGLGPTWTPHWDHPGFLNFRCDTLPYSINCTPDHEGVTGIAFEVIGDSDHAEYDDADENLTWPLEGRSVESFMAIMGPMLDKWSTNPSPSRTVTLVLEMTGDDDDIDQAIEDVLDAGHLQDALNECDGVHVVSAVSR